MGGVCASPIAHQFGAVLGIRRSFASGSRWDPPSTGRDCFLLFIGGDLPHSTGRDCFLLFIGWGGCFGWGHESTYPSFACIVLGNKKGALPVWEGPFFLPEWWGDYFRNLKLATIGGSIAVPLQTRKKQMRLRTIAMTIQIPITIQPRKGMTARTNESAVTTWIFRA